MHSLRELTQEEVQEHVDAIERDGYSVMHNAIDAEFADSIATELERLQKARPGGDIAPGPFTGEVTRRWFDVLNDGDVWQRVAVHPWIMQVIPRILGDGFLLSTMGSAIVGSIIPIPAFIISIAIKRPPPNKAVSWHIAWNLTIAMNSNTE